jgi:hypothetical protein
MGLTQRAMPVRADNWSPADPIFDNIIRRCVRDVEGAEAGETSSEFMAGAIVLALIAVVLLVATQSAQAAIIVPALLAGAGLCYVATRPGGAGKRDRTGALAVIGGPGRLPATYLVHPDAWQAGLAEHLAKVPESQLQACAQLCRQFPGTVDDLLGFTGTIAARIAAHQRPADTVERRTRELVRIGRPLLEEHLVRNPPLGVSGGKGTKKR